MSDEKRDNIEIRLHKDGTLDEIVIDDPHTGKCLFHVEQMDDHYFWMRAYGTTQDLVVHIGAGIGTRNGKPIEDERGFITSYEQVPNCPVVETNYEWDDSTHESETHTDFHTPEAERHHAIAELINRYGVACMLQDIAAVIKKGRMAEHEQGVVADLDNAQTKFLAGDKAYWDARIAEDYGKEE